MAKNKLMIYVQLAVFCENMDKFEDRNLCEEAGYLSRTPYQTHNPATGKTADEHFYELGWRQADFQTTLCPKCAERAGIK